MPSGGKKQSAKINGRRDIAEATTSLDIIIVNWNTGQQLRDCLDSICAAGRDGLHLGRIIVVDNASSDGSADELDDVQLPVSVIRNPENSGFAAACNQGAAGSSEDYLLFLNPDTRLFQNSLSVPITFMEKAENQQVGICGIQLVDDQGRVSRNCARFPTPMIIISSMLGLDIFLPHWFPSHFMKEWDHGSSREVDQVMGAFFLVRRKVFEAFGGFDERFFVYFEDVDFSFRVRKEGWWSVFLCEAQAFHRGAGSSEQVKAKRLFYVLRSRILYGYKHFGFLAGTGLLLAAILIEPVARIVWHITHRSGSEIMATLAGYVMLCIDIPRILKRTLS